MEKELSSENLGDVLQGSRAGQTPFFFAPERCVEPERARKSHTSCSFVPFPAQCRECALRAWPADNDAESTTRRSQSGKGEADTAKKDGDSGHASCFQSSSQLALTHAHRRPETICNWLAQLGLSQYATQFLAHHVTGSNLEELDKEALQLIGVQSWGHRCSILKSITRIKGPSLFPLPSSLSVSYTHLRAHETEADL
eukprot:2055625-Rhodomonas_salina.1